MNFDKQTFDSGLNDILDEADGSPLSQNHQHWNRTTWCDNLYKEQD